MNRKVISLFLFVFLITAIVINGLFFQLSKKYYHSLEAETSIIRESIKERFKLYLNADLIAGLFAAEQLSMNKANNYQNLGKLFIKEFTDTIGFNLIDPHGTIIDVYPRAQNKSALDKKTQNFIYILNSVRNHQPYWLSPPFDLFQGETGFGFYVPVFKKQKLHGWVAQILSTEKFFKTFGLKVFLDKYHLVIKDLETNQNFISTSPLPNKHRVTFSKTEIFFGRRIMFYSWHKNPTLDYKIPWYHSLCWSFLLSVLITYTINLHFQRQKNRSHLIKINQLIHYTSEEAETTLTNFHKEINLLGSATGYVAMPSVQKYVTYISTLLDQISYTEKFSHPNRVPEFQIFEIHPLLVDQIELFKTRFEDKNVSIHIDDSIKTVNFQVKSNKWILSNSALGNILRYLLFYIKPYSMLNITTFSRDHFSYLSFHCLLDDNESTQFPTELMDRCIIIAKEVLKMSHGEIEFIERPVGNRTIFLKFKTVT